MMGHLEEESKVEEEEEERKREVHSSGDKQTKIFFHLHLYSPYIRFNYFELIRSVFHRKWISLFAISGWCIIIVINKVPTIGFEFKHEDARERPTAEVSSVPFRFPVFWFQNLFLLSQLFLSFCHQSSTFLGGEEERERERGLGYRGW